MDRSSPEELNASNARLYRLSLTKVSSGELLPYRVIATDGSLLDRPRPAREDFLSPGERVDLLLDLRGFEVGEELALANLTFSAGDGQPEHPPPCFAV